jgi:hypothetical protein
MSGVNDALNDECEALNSIYGSDTIVVSAAESGVAAVLRLPNLPFSFLLAFPFNYPDTSPEVRGTNSTGGSGRGEGGAVLAVLREVLGRTFNPGQVCLFDLVEEVLPLLKSSNHGKTEDTLEDIEDRSVEPERYPAAGTLTANPASNLTPPAWTMSESLTINKSIFVARACPASSLSEVTDAVSHLLATNKKVASATHNIKAWRLRNEAVGSTVQDYDDDGETAAGGRLLHLLQLMDVWNVLVVVTRWYGGVKLGPDRFRVINNVARDAVVAGGFVKDDSKGKPKGKGKG